MPSRASLAVLGLMLAVGGASTSASAAPEPTDILVSRQLLAHAHLAVGDLVTLATDRSGTRSTLFRVAGVYEPTPDPMRFSVERLEVRMHLPDLVGLTADPDDPQAAESATAINIALVNPADRDKVAAELTSRTVAMVARPTARAEEGDPFAVLERFHFAIAAVTVAGSTAFLIALMVIRAEERRETVGVLRLIGISRKSILLGVVVEALLVAIMGAVFGVVLAAVAQYGVNGYFQRRYDTALVFVRVTPLIAARSVAVALPVGVIAGVVACWTTLRRQTTSLVRR